MRRDTTNVVLILVGGTLVRITVDGTYLHYVTPATQPWLLTAGAAMIALAAAALIRDLRTPQPPTRDHRAAALLVLPVLAVFLMTPPPLGADSVLRDGNRTAPPTASATFPPLPDTPVVPLPLTDFVTRAVWDHSHALTGRTIALTGFVVHENDRNYVARLVITCCAADATPMRVGLTGPSADPLPDDQWITVTGTLVPHSATQADGYTPTLTVTTLTTTTAPADPYEH